MMSSTITFDESLRSFLQQAGSANPTPGGGSVAALITALGASMTSMVSNLSQGEKFAHIQLQITDTLEKMNSLTVACEQLLVDDMACFNTYMEALKLPKNTDEEKRIRMNAIHEATIQAIHVPLRLIEVCKEGMLYTHSISESANKNVISDLGIGAILFEAAAQSASLTVEINLAGLKDLQLKKQYSETLFTLITEIEELKDNVLKITRKRIIQ